MPVQNPSQLASLLRLAADHPEHAERILGAAGWELRDDTPPLQQTEQAEPDADDGSQVPPARDSKGHPAEQYDKEAHADVWAKAAAQVQASRT